jgi:hypothetical protein
LVFPFSLKIQKQNRNGGRQNLDNPSTIPADLLQFVNCGPCGLKQIVEGECHVWVGEKLWRMEILTAIGGTGISAPLEHFPFWTGFGFLFFALSFFTLLACFGRKVGDNYFGLGRCSAAHLSVQ